MIYKYFIDRPVFASVISILITIAGIMVLLKLPVAQYPEISPPTVSVSASYPGASPEVVERSVAAHIEEQVNGAEGMVSMSSTSSNDGSYSLTITFEVGMDLDMATVAVQNRVSQAEAKLPDTVKRQGITVKKQASNMLAVVNIISPNESYDALFLLNYSKININDALSRVPGVGKVEAFGAGEFSLRIWVDPNKMAGLAVTASDIEQALRDQNMLAPAGQVGLSPAPEGTMYQYTVRVQGQLNEVEEFENIIIKSADQGGLVRLRDVARVELGASFYSAFSRFSGKPTTSLIIYQLPGANAIAVMSEVKKKLSQLSGFFPDDISYQIAFDTTEFVSASIEEVAHTFLEAILLVFLVVFIFLQSWRATIIPMIAVPVSLIGTFIAFPAMGFTINTLTLFGLVLAIGLVVDDAIVVVEAAQHKLDKEGLSPREATMKAMDEVAGPVVANGLTLAAVFIPVAFLGGITGQLYKQFALTLTVSVGISVINALTLSPALSVLLLRKTREKKGPLGWFYSLFNRFFDRCTKIYTRGVRFTLRARLLTIGMLVLVFFATYGLFKVLPSGFVPPEDQGYFMLSIQLPAAASLERTDRFTREVEKHLDSVPGVKSYISLGGFNLFSGGVSSNFATLVVVLDNWEHRSAGKLGVEQIVNSVNRHFSRSEEALVFAFSTPAIAGLGTTGGVEILIQDRSGAGIAALAEASDQFMAAARGLNETAGVFSTFSMDVPQLSLEIDREKAKNLGISLSQVYHTLQSFLGGLYVNEINKFGRSYFVQLQAKPQFRALPEDIKQFHVRTEQGVMVPISTILSINEISGPEFVSRYNMYPAISISIQGAGAYSSGQLITALEDTAARVLPQGFGYEWSGLALQEKKSAGQYGPVFALALLMVFLCLAALYESWAIPFAVLFALPLGAFGAFGGQLLRGLENNVYAQIGLVMLIGLAAKNAVLIVEYAKDAHEKKGLNFYDAAVEAASIRFRPILMTSLAFIFGVLPLVLASGAGAAARHALGTSVFAGMIAATLLGLIMVPFLYAIVCDTVAKIRGRA